MEQKKKDPKCFPGGSDGKESTCIRPTFDPCVQKIPWRREWLPTPLFLSGLPCSSDGKESACNVGDLGLTPGSERSSGEWQPTPVFLPGESHGQRSLAGLQSMESQRVGHN